MRGVLAELLIRLDIPHESSQVLQAINDAAGPQDDGSADAMAMTMMRAGTAVGMRLVPLEIANKDVWELLLDGFPIAMIDGVRAGQKDAMVLSNVSAGRVDCTRFHEREKVSETLSSSALRKILSAVQAPMYFIAEPSLTCEQMSSRYDSELVAHSHTHGDSDHEHSASHSHLPPLRRWLRLLKMDASDIWTLGIFSLVVSVLDLAIPLAVEQMVTTIGFASVIQPLIWIAVLLFAILTLSAIIKALQLFVVEILQRRMMVRVVGDLAVRLPRLDRSELEGMYGPEMANRFFDVITMQKSTASLLVDALTLVIQTLTGLMLLAVYSPFLLAFDIVLLLCMTIVIYLLGKGAVRTAIEESLIKYRIAHWLEDIIGNPNAFQVHGGSELAMDRSNRMIVEYLAARRKHFVVLIRQSLFALLLNAVSISALLSLGGWLVLTEALSIGQLVASVSVVALVVGGFAKIGKSLESYYDLMAATDKVGHLIDLPTIAPARAIDAGIGPVTVRLRGLRIGQHHHEIAVPSISINAGERVAVIGEGRCGKSSLLQTLAGVQSPLAGLAEIGGIDSRDVNRFAEGSMVGFVSESEVFHGTLVENVSLNRLSIMTDDVRDSLQTADLWDEVLAMPRGLESQLQTAGYPLSHTQMERLMIARAIVARPRLLLIDGTLDRLPPEMRLRIWETIRAAEQPWTILIVTHDPEILRSCSQRIELTPESGGGH
jgi:putative ABC transport system ATP-binding protein